MIEPPLITEEDIKDRSKGDAISKMLIILQTIWFIAQCVARWSSNLPVTELEVVTLGFAMLNGVTYGLWWDKPQNVGRPVFVEIKDRSPQGAPSNPSSLEPEIIVGQASLLEPSPIPQNATPSRLRIYFEYYASYKPWMLLYLIPLYFCRSLLRPLGKLAGHPELKLYIMYGYLRVPMFHSHDVDNSTVYRMTAIIGVLFGSVHLIPSWFSDFASVQEKWLWRVSAIVIMVGPVLLGFAEFGGFARSKNTSGGLLIMTLPLYIISRIILLTLSLTSLRLLPPAALQTIEWTTFIPHI